MQTEQEQRAETVIAGFGGDLIEHGSIIAGALHDAGLLAAPVDGELREALERDLWQMFGGLKDAEGEAVGPSDIADYVQGDLLPIIAAYVAAQERKAAGAEREEIYAAIRASWRCPHDDPKEQADCYWQRHGEDIIRDLETERGE